MSNIYTLIMAGGSGTRFWPRSKVAKPKQYLNLFGTDSLLQSTINRFTALTSPDKIYIVSGKSQASVLEEQATLLPIKNLIYEPVGKNTLPCIGLAAMIIEEEDKDGILVVSPSDHLIENNQLFGETVKTAVKIAEEKNGIVTLGITPTYPATGYGYVKTDEEITGSEKIRQFKVERFVEKPNESTAISYLDQGGFYWNSGLFIFKISVLIEAIKKFAPLLYNDLRRIQAEIGKPSFEPTLNEIYTAVKGISIDYGIMEYADNIFLVEGNFGWNDLGSWESVFLTSEKDLNGNAVKGESVIVNAHNSYIYSENGLIALVGLDDVIVVQEGNITLVCSRDKAEDIKAVVDQLKESGKTRYL